MKLILLTALIALAFTASEVKGVDITVAKVATADLDYTCMATFDPAGANDVVQTAAQDKVAWTWTGATAAIATDTKMFSCIIASTDATNIVFGTGSGSCYNVTVGASATTGTVWTADTYKFNCTDKTTASTALEGQTCKLYFNVGKTAVEFAAVADGKTLTQLITSAQGVANLSVTAADYKNGQITVPASGSECEDQSNAVTATFAGVAALAAASFF